MYHLYTSLYLKFMCVGVCVRVRARAHTNQKLGFLSELIQYKFVLQQSYCKKYLYYWYIWR